MSGNRQGNRSQMPSPVASEMPSPLAPEVPAEEAAEAPAEVEAQPIEVVALRAGFYDLTRRSEGDVFTVNSMEELGSWMKCTDKEIEKVHQKMMAEKKKKAAAGK